MLQERITAIMDGQVIPLPGVPLLSSAGSGWSSFLLEVHVGGESRDELGWSWHNTHVGVCTEGPASISVSGAAGSGHFLVQSGDVSLFPKGCGHTNIHYCCGNYQFTVVEIDNARLEQLFHDQARTIDNRLTPQLYVSDPGIAALIRSMRAEVEAGCPSDSLYGESLCLALVVYLASRYSAKASSTYPVHPVHYKFSNEQVRLLRDCIHTHVEGNLSLVELAGLVFLSPRHFSRLFRNTFGMAPYQYVMRERVRQAQELLLAGQQPIVEIAASTGFASQSYFTEVFRRTTGVSPLRYRQAHRLG